MDVRQAVQQALKSSSTRAVQATDDEVDIDLQELQVADYIVFLLALETYMGWLEETVGSIPLDNPILRKGIGLARLAERQNLAAIGTFIKSNLVSKASITLLEAAIRPPPTPAGLAIRATKLRTVLSKGGTATTKAVFGTSIKARREVQEAIDASMIDDPDAALNKFSALTLRNKKLEKWIDEASDAVPGDVIVNPIQEATKGTTEASTALLNAQVQQEAKPGTDQSIESRAKHADTLAEVEAQATEVAKKALARSDEEDRPLTRSEVIGVATATATAVTSDPSRPQNIPAALQGISNDPEQLAAALTGGKVRVSAGAGSGKSTTLLARTQYLVDQGGVPNRMMAMSFNKKAADELAVKMAAKIGSNRVSTSKNPNPNGVLVGTMHSTFLNLINQFGTPAQVNIFAKVPKDPKDPRSPKVGGMVNAGSITKAVKAIWEECFANIDKDPVGDPNGSPRTVPADELWKMPPKSKRMTAYMNVFQGDGMSLEQAQAWASERGTIEADQAAKFFEVYEGLKGGLGVGWRPNFCGDKPSPTFSKFVDFNRGGKPRVGDFNDMLTVFRDIMRENPAAKQKVQGQLDHIMVDECQDLNPLQFEVLQHMTGHIETDDPKRSFWMVGDDKQCIYQFRGAEPNNFIKLDKMGFKDRQITTNYRCAPEFIDAANKLIANNSNQIPMEAKAAPTRARGEANLTVVTPRDPAEAAAMFGQKILASSGEALSNFAVLARTNGELGVYQQVCATVGIPFVQKKASSVFSSQETESFRAFLQAVMSQDPKVLQASFGQALLSGGLHTIKAGGAERPDAIKAFNGQIKKSIATYCQKNRRPLADFDPFNEANSNPDFLAAVLSEVSGKQEWAAKKDAENGAPLMEGISLLREHMAESAGKKDGTGNPEFNTKQLFEAVLELPVYEVKPPAPGSNQWIRRHTTLRKSTEERLAARNAQEDADTDVELEDTEKAHLGTLDFVQLMMEPSAVDPSYNPLDPDQFHARFEGLADRAEELRIDPDEWEKKQDNAGVRLADRKPPPGVYLGTIHSTKGAEWEDVTLLMPKGIFPLQKKGRKPKDNEVPEEPIYDAESELESERRLGYVALTRPKKSLTIMSTGGISPFVAEAGLHVGQNVPRPETETPNAVPATPGEVDKAMADEAASEGPPEEDHPDEEEHPSPLSHNASHSESRDSFKSFIDRLAKANAKYTYHRGDS